MNSPYLQYDAAGALLCEEAPLEELARRFGTPLYVYSRKSFASRFDELDAAFDGIPHKVCFSVKSCSNLAVLELLAKRGAGMDIVSGGELFRARRAGVEARNIVFAGVGKSREEIREALEEGILFFTAESAAELARINEVAGGMGRRAPVALRLNPDVDPKTHKYISTGKKENKFGVDLEGALEIYGAMRTMPALEPVGVHMHIGSQILDPGPHAQALEKVVDFVARLRSQGHAQLRYLDIGGGFGIRYKEEEQPLDVRALAAKLAATARATGLELVLEPGRYIAGPSGILLTRVEYVKVSGDRRFVIVDAAMNDLVRPSLYGAYHHVRAASREAEGRARVTGSVVGPVCESGDFLALDRELPAVRAGELLVVEDAGAYGFSMASNYNSRRRAAEVLVEGADVRLIRRRETYEDLVRAETGA